MMLRRMVFRRIRPDDVGKGAYTVFLKRDTSMVWEGVNPVLLDREPGIDITYNELRIGDGVTPWNDLPPATPEDALELLLGARPDAP